MYDLIEHMNLNKLSQYRLIVCIDNIDILFPKYKKDNVGHMLFLHKSLCG